MSTGLDKLHAAANWHSDKKGKLVHMWNTKGVMTFVLKNRKIGLLASTSKILHFEDQWDSWVVPAAIICI